MDEVNNVYFEGTEFDLNDNNIMTIRSKLIEKFPDWELDYGNFIDVVLFKHNKEILIEDLIIKPSWYFNTYFNSNRDENKNIYKNKNTIFTRFNNHQDFVVNLYLKELEKGYLQFRSTNKMSNTHSFFSEGLNLETRKRNKDNFGPFYSNKVEEKKRMFHRRLITKGFNPSINDVLNYTEPYIWEEKYNLLYKLIENIYYD